MASPDACECDAAELARLRQENQDLHGANAALRQDVAEERLKAAGLARQVEHWRHQAEVLRQAMEQDPWHVRRLRTWLGRTLRQLRTPRAEREAVGVFVHLFYADLAEEFAGYLARVPEPKRLYLSTDTPDKAAHIERVVAAAGLADRADIRVFPNRGFDVGPFLVGFREEIRKHELILRLHGKKSTQLGEAGPVWRREILDSLLGDAARIERILSTLRAQPELGMVFPEHWAGLYRLYDAPIAIGSNLVTMAKLLSRYDVALPDNLPIEFPSGSMFWCRSRVLEPWLRFDFSWDSFEESREDVRDASLAHALERLFLFGCGLEGLTWARADALVREG